jgi:pimeloyl-ACP methyl ester carboxylesterase
MRAALFTDPLGQGRRSRYTLGYQLPILPERQLVARDAARVGELLERWSAPGWPDPDTEQIYESAMQIPSAAHSALEYHRWLARSGLRPDGLRYARHMHTPIAAPVLHLHGALDSCVLPQTARGAGRYVEGPYRWRVIDGAGHFPQEERPEVLTNELLGWLADPEPER